MRTRFALTSIVGLMAVLLASASAAAASSPLLSGYGGPGQGIQAILGSALLNGPPAGGGGTAGAAAATVAGAEGPSERSPRDRPPGARSNAPGARALPSAPGQSAFGADRASVRPASDALGLSGIDFVYIALGIGVLAFAGFSTRWLARGPGQQGINR